jgi:hypothetical protein
MRWGKLGHSWMPRRWQYMCYELRLPANKPRPRASRGWWLWQNLTESALLGIIGGTIGWRVAYSLLRGLDSNGVEPGCSFQGNWGRFEAGCRTGARDGRPAGRVLSWPGSPDLSRACTSNTWNASGCPTLKPERQQKTEGRSNRDSVPVLERARDADVS